MNQEIGINEIRYLTEIENHKSSSYNIGISPALKYDSKIPPIIQESNASISIKFGI